MRRSKLQDLRVRDVMSADPVTVSPDETLGDVLGKMRKHGIHEVPVLRGKLLAGVVTMTGIMRRKGVPPTTGVATLLQIAPEVTPDTDLPSVAETMIQGGFRAAPVCERKRLVGIVSRTDLVRAIAEDDEFAELQVGGVMSPSPQVVSEDDTLEHAIRTMQSLGERSVPVVDRNRRLVGVVGHRDLAEVLGKPKEKSSAGERAGEKTRLALQVKGVMRYPVVTVGPEATVRHSAELMLKHDISSVVVLEKEEPVGVVTKLDLVELLAGLKERQELLVQISGLEDEPEDAYDALYGVIEKAMKKIAQVVTPRSLTVHVQKYKAEGDRSKYSLRARFTTTHKMYYISHFDWDLHLATAGLMGVLGSQILKEKERRITEKRRRRAP